MFSKHFSLLVLIYNKQCARFPHHLCTPDANVLIELITVQLSLSNDLIFLYNLSTDTNYNWISSMPRLLVHYVHRVNTNYGC